MVVGVEIGFELRIGDGEESACEWGVTLMILSQCEPFVSYCAYKCLGVTKHMSSFLSSMNDWSDTFLHLYQYPKTHGSEVKDECS